MNETAWSGIVLTGLGGTERYLLANSWRDRAVMSGKLQVDFSSELGYSRELQWHTIISCSYHTDYLNRQLGNCCVFILQVMRP